MKSGLGRYWLLIYNSGNQLDVAIGTADAVSVRDAELFALFTRWIERWIAMMM